MRPRPRMTIKRNVSWSATDAERDERISRSQAIVGSRLAAVRYYDIDYRRDEVAQGVTGPREITAADEWTTPIWKYGACDSIDYGLELDTDRGQTFSITWDPPGPIAGIGIEEERLVGMSLREDSGVAIWDVTGRSGWQAHRNAVIEGIDLDYEPWNETGGWWCPKISLHLSSGDVEIILGEGQPDGTIRPSADNVAVLFSSEDRLPDS